MIGYPRRDNGLALCDPKSRRHLRLRMVAAAALLTIAAPGCERIEAITGQRPPAVSEGALRAAATDPRVNAFYQRRQWKPAWSPDQAKALLAALDQASRHGLDASRFTGLIKSAEGNAARDAELTLAALTYGKALLNGVLDPSKLHETYAVERPKTDVAASLEPVLQSGGSIAAWLDGLAPNDPEYAALSKAYLAYRAQAAVAKEEPIGAGPTLHVGSADPRVPAIARRLSVGGYLPDGVAARGEGVFSAAMSRAVKSLQRDAKLPDTGRVDEATVRALNEAPADRARQLAVNMERRRWLPRDVPITRIDVNTASAEMVYVRDGASAWTGRVIVGDPEHPTPPLIGGFKQLVVNPPWNVPDGIAQEEILPKGEAYLAQENMYVEDGRVVQRPGPDAALGLVKFDMQNKHAIYLHDTPAKAIFQSDARHRSHGCVRVERAIEFARTLAGETGKAGAFDEALASGETQTVALGRDIPVRLLYHTAYVEGSGRLMFADDAYGWDDRVGQALGLEPSRRRSVATVAHLLGP